MMFLLLFASASILAADGSDPPPPPPATATVVSVYDGDTVTLDTGDRVRLRWVNTPELRPAEDYGTEARDAARAFVLHKRVELVVNPETPRDGYGRIIAGLRTEQGDLSVYLAERGLAHVFLIPPDPTDLSELLAAQARAKAAHLGIWSTSRYAGALHITSFHANGKGDDEADPNVEYLRLCNVSDGPVDLSAYTLTNRAGQRWTLPPVVLPAGHTVKIHSGKGEHQADPGQQIAVHLQSDRPIWDDTDDVATLLDAQGAVVDRREHRVKR